MDAHLPAASQSVTHAYVTALDCSPVPAAVLGVPKHRIHGGTQLGSRPLQEGGGAYTTLVFSPPPRTPATTLPCCTVSMPAALAARLRGAPTAPGACRLLVTWLTKSLAPSLPASTSLSSAWMWELRGAPVAGPRPSAPARRVPGECLHVGAVGLQHRHGPTVLS